MVTGSGSGKSSLAFDTVYSEGQRRYVETFSSYAHQFPDRMDKPRFDETGGIDGIPPCRRSVGSLRTARPMRRSTGPRSRDSRGSASTT